MAPTTGILMATNPSDPEGPLCPPCVGRRMLGRQVHREMKDLKSGEIFNIPSVRHNFVAFILGL